MYSEVLHSGGVNHRSHVLKVAPSPAFRVRDSECCPLRYKYMLGNIPKEPCNFFAGVSIQTQQITNIETNTKIEENMNTEVNTNTNKESDTNIESTTRAEVK